MEIKVRRIVELDWCVCGHYCALALIDFMYSYVELSELKAINAIANQRTMKSILFSTPQFRTVLN